MELLTPGTGLIFWQLVVFVALVFLLGRYAWRPLLGALALREQHISDSLAAANQAQAEKKATEKQSQQVLNEAAQMRDDMLKQAQKTAEQLRDKAKAEAAQIRDDMVAQAKVQISSEEIAATQRIHGAAVELSLALTQRILADKLQDPQALAALTQRYLKDITKQ